jgi:hypothetical protein
MPHIDCPQGAKKAERYMMLVANGAPQPAAKLPVKPGIPQQPVPEQRAAAGQVARQQVAKKQVSADLLAVSCAAHLQSA